MRKSTIWLLTGVLIFAFIGLLYLQINYIRIILENREERFDDAVKRSLFQVSRDLELDETKQLFTDRVLKKYTGGSSGVRLSLSMAPVSPSFGKNDFQTVPKLFRKHFATVLCINKICWKK